VLTGIFLYLISGGSTGMNNDKVSRDVESIEALL